MSKQFKLSALSKELQAKIKEELSKFSEKEKKYYEDIHRLPKHQIEALEKFIALLDNTLMNLKQMHNIFDESLRTHEHYEYIRRAVDQSFSALLDADRKLDSGNYRDTIERDEDIEENVMDKKHTKYIRHQYL